MVIVAVISALDINPPPPLLLLPREIALKRLKLIRPPLKLISSVFYHSLSCTRLFHYVPSHTCVHDNLFLACLVLWNISYLTNDGISETYVCQQPELPPDRHCQLKLPIARRCPACRTPESACPLCKHAGVAGTQQSDHL